MTTQPGMTAAINGAAPDHIIADLQGKIDADFMSKLCGAIQMSHDPAPVTSPHQKFGR